MSHYEERLERDLTAVRKQVADMAILVETATRNAMHALQTGNNKLASATIIADHEINRSMRHIDDLCHKFIALHLPTAGHLRMLSSIIRANIELERIGDYAADSAAIVMQMEGRDLSRVGVADVLKLSYMCIRMLDEVLTAYLQKDAENAKKAARMDDEIDAWHAKLVDSLFSTMQENPGLVPDASRMLWISHNLERCADRGTNIAEQIAKGIYHIDSVAEFGEVDRKSVV